MAAPFANYAQQKAMFGKDPVAAKKMADAAKSKHQPVYTGEPKASIMANTPGHPHQSKGKGMPPAKQAAIQRRLSKKKGKKGMMPMHTSAMDTNMADDKMGMNDNPADDTGKSPVGKSSGGGAMNAGFKAYLAAHKKK